MIRTHLARWTGLLCAVLPGLAAAHGGDGASAGWWTGFEHPFSGWDHLLAMLAVGWWAARHRGGARWTIPLNFVAVMVLGALVGASGARLPGTEWAIAASVVVFALCAARAVRLLPGATLLVVSGFAFFHGFAHGQELPAAMQLGVYGGGFVLATLTLHGLGFCAARLVTLALMCGAAAVQADDGEGLPEVLVRGRQDSLLGLAPSASTGHVGIEQLRYRPVLRPGEVLETVPGLIVSQHSGEGKANQYYLRGFNLDHGTDFLTQVDGVPINLPTHAHGQGWTDTAFLIPELVSTIGYQKGPYYAANGDFASAGAANIEYVDTLPTGVASYQGGEFDFHRALLADSQALGAGTLLAAFEGVYNNGPWQRGDHYRKANGVLRYAQERGDSAWRVTFMGYKADWDSTDQIPRRAVARGDIDRFGLVDPSDGGDSERYSLSGEWRRRSALGTTRALVYGYYSKLDLYSNFTYRLSDPVRGDQFAQPDQRGVFGVTLSHQVDHALAGAPSRTTFGFQQRNDVIANALELTERRRTHTTVREDDVVQSSFAPYAETLTRWLPWLRTSVGLRADVYRFAVESDRAINSDTRWAALVSPKGGLVLGPWAQTEVYLNAGTGFHSNDGRGVNTRLDPNDGTAVARAKPLVRTYGAELGLRGTWLPGLQSSVALWGLDSDSELVFVGDAGTTDAGRPSRRVGVEFANHYTVLPWLDLDADLSLSRARFRDLDPAGRHVPGAVESVLAAGATVHDLDGWFGALRLRYFGPRALIEDDSVRSNATLLLSARVGYEVRRGWRVFADVFNLLDREDSAIDYYYASRLPGEPPGPSDGGYDDVHFHPVEPRSFRLGVSLNF
ncbi:MAG: TonB-dependent receptor [Gammaproteobacteria bacterium]